MTLSAADAQALLPPGVRLAAEDGHFLFRAADADEFELWVILPGEMQVYCRVPEPTDAAGIVACIRKSCAIAERDAMAMLKALSEVGWRAS